MSDPVVGPTLRAIHDRPSAPWTVETLAREANVSRAAYARRFAGLLNEAPIAYLTGWRLCLAADLLRDTDDTVESVARQVGYANAFALSAAFARQFGHRPTEHRRLANGA
nr:AraC family transcriptional regulator [Naumannella cuiyingiana]